MKSSDILERLKALTQLLGIDTGECTKVLGELLAYTKGLSLISGDFEDMFNNIFLDTCDREGLSLFAEMTGVIDYTGDDVKERIVKVASEKLSIFTFSYFEEKMAQLLPNSTYSVERYSIEFDCLEEGEGADYALSQLIKEAVPCFIIPRCSGNGRSFEQWEKTGFAFGEYDRLGLPFSVLDTMKGA